jgi:hypothetical protein
LHYKTTNHETSINSNNRNNTNIFTNNLQKENYQPESFSYKSYPSRVTNDVEQLKKVKNKLRYLEQKVVNFNKGISIYNLDENEKKVIDSMRDFRYKRLSHHK